MQKFQLADVKQTKYIVETDTGMIVIQSRPMVIVCHMYIHHDHIPHCKSRLNGKLTESEFQFVENVSGQRAIGSLF